MSLPDGLTTERSRQAAGGAPCVHPKKKKKKKARPRAGPPPQPPPSKPMSGSLSPALGGASGNGSAPAVIIDVTALLLDTLGYTDDEFVSLGHQDTDGVFHTAVGSPARASAYADALPRTADVFFGVNPVTGPARSNAGAARNPT